MSLRSIEYGENSSRVYRRNELCNKLCNNSISRAMVPNKIYKPLYESARYFIFLIAALDFYPHFFMYICHLFFIYLCLFGYTHAIQNGTVVTDWTQYSFYAAM